jgi:spermidine/putrescine transport system permease protein
MRKHPVCFTITILVLLFLYFPIVMLIGNSFNASRFGGIWGGFSLKWYYQLFQEKALWEAFTNSLIVAFFSTIASTVIGSLAAFALYRYKTPFQKFHYGMIYTPLIIPDILMGISLLLFFILIHLNLGLLTITIAHTTFCLSYVTLVVLSKLENFDYSIVEAAQDLGANSWTMIKKVLLPLLAPGLYAAALLAFTLSIDDFVITFFVAGEGSQTLPLYIYSMIKFGSTPVINALSTIILIATFVSIGIIKKISKDVGI